MSSTLPAALRVIRPLNLLFIALTQFLLMYCILKSVITSQEHEAQLGFPLFSLLVLSTMLIAAAGYVINDYFDIKADQINKPDKVVVGKHLTRRQAIALHLVLTSAGVVIGIMLGIVVGRIWLASIHIVSATLLWFYSTYFKKRMLSGNAIVSGLTALVPVTVLLYQTPTLTDPLFTTLAFYTILYAGFAFLVSMIREIVKDMQDMHGDAGDDCCTLPIVVGLRPSKIIVNALVIITLVGLGFLQYLVMPDRAVALVIYILLLIQLPLIFVMAKLRPADRAADFRIISYFIKGIMLMGILTMPLLYLTTNVSSLLTEAILLWP